MTQPPRQPRPTSRSTSREGTPVARRPAGSRPRSTARPSAAPRPPHRVAMGRPRVRLHGGLLAVLVMLSLIGGRLVWLQGFQAEAYAAEATKQRLSTVTLTAPRGSISDRNGQVLALSVDARAVYGEPRTIAKANCPAGAARPCTPATIAAALAPVLGLPAAELEAQLVLAPKATGAACSTTELLGCKGFAYLARGLEAEQANRVRALGLVGIGTVAEPRRVAPGKDLGANVVGFTTVEGNGAAGVELSLDKVLSGVDGKTVAEVDGGGRVIPSGYTETVEPRPGRDVQLTLDRDLQWYAQKVLADKIAETGAESGSATVLDVRTGEVLALVSVPTLDANDAADAPAELRGNRAVSDVFEPGSVGKVLTLAAALEAGTITPDTVIPVEKTIRLGGKNFSDSSGHTIGRLTATGVLVMSSNVGTIKIAQGVGAEKLRAMLGRLGLGVKTGLGLPGESRGIVPEVKDWSGSSYGTIPIGQGYAVNGVQMASVYATVANGGVRLTPTIVKATRGPDGGLDPAPPAEQKRVLDQRVADQLRGMMEGVTLEGGTAVTAAIPGYRVAGKTGTAQRVVNGRYDGSYTAGFTGFAPADAPRIAISVSVQAPRTVYYGGAVAGPVFSDIMKFALRTMQVPPTGAASPKLRLRADDPS